jgi:hypothetical protein
MYVYIPHIEAAFLVGDLAKRSKFEGKKLTLFISCPAVLGGRR